MPEISFRDRVVIVTGAGAGLGRSYALDIARRGGAVVVNDLGGPVDGEGGSPEPADRVVAEIEAEGGRALASYDSVASWESASRLVESTVDTFGRVDAVINNAGNMRYGPFESFSGDDLAALLSVHLLGTFNVTRAAWPHMQRQGYGRVVSTSSSAGMYGDRHYACYGAAKAGVTGLMNVLSHEGEEHGILCNVLMPNAITRMTDSVSSQMDRQDIGATAALMAAIGNSMEPAFSTGLAVYLASEACTSTRGIYSSCGGRMARVVIGVGAGWQGSRDQPATAEDIAEHFGQISALPPGLQVPQSPGDEFRIVVTGSGSGS